MSELGRIVLAAILTIVGVVFVRLFVEPIHHLRSHIGKIADSLVFYANVYCNPGAVRKEMSDEASEALRRQASQLKARAYAVPWYPLWELLKIVRKKTEIEEASAELIGLSNSVHGGPAVSAKENSGKRKRVEKLLGIVSDKDVKLI